MPVYEFECKKCENVWEDLFNKSDPMPEKCPKCRSKKIGRLLSYCSGSVTLTGQDLKSHIKNETNNIRRSLKKNENARANLVGESNYHNAKSSYESLQKEYKHKG